MEETFARKKAGASDRPVPGALEGHERDPGRALGSADELLPLVVGAADELNACSSLDTFYRRAVDLARERLGAERCGFLLLDGDLVRGTYGTDAEGRTVDEYAHCFEPARLPSWPERIRAMHGDSARWYPYTNEEYVQHGGGESRTISRGWVVLTPIHRDGKLVAFLSNDAAITGSAMDKYRQDALAVYGSLLGCIMDRIKTHERWRALAGTAVDYIIITQPDGTIQFVNRVPEGYREEEVVGSSVYDYVDEAYRRPAQRLIRHVLATGRFAQNEVPGVGSNGTPHWYNARVGPFRQDGAAGGVTMFVTDITRRRRRDVEKEKRARHLSALNDMAIELSSMVTVPDVQRLVGDRLRDMSGALMTVICGYHAKSGTVTADYISAHPAFLKALTASLGREIAGMSMSLPQAMSEVMVAKKVAPLPDLCEVTFGAIPRPVARKAAGDLGIGTILGLALQYRGVLIGSGSLMLPEDQPAPSKDILENFCNLAGAALLQKQAEKKINAYQEELRTLASQLSLAEERERRQIATELHDHVIQGLALSKIKLGQLRPGAAKDIEAAVEEVRQLLDRTIKETRSLTFELSPPVLYELGIEAAVEWLAEQLGERHGIECKVTRDNERKPMAAEDRVTLFQATRELLNNIVKHAQATHVDISITRRNAHVQVEVSDNGIGFDPSSIAPPSKESGRFGLFNIRERLGGLNGSMEIDSHPRHGTRVTLRAPIDPAEA